MKKNYIFILCFFALTFNIHSQDCNIGNETIDDNPLKEDISSNYLLGVKHTLSQEGTLNSINLVGNDTDSGVQMAVYDDIGGVPNNLIVSSSQGTVGNGVISLPVTPTVLPAGDYWIMAVYEFDGQHSELYSVPGNAVYYQGLNYGDNMPNNASGFDSYSGHDFLYFLDIDCGDCNIGNETIDDNPLKDDISSNYLLGVKHTLSQEGTLNSINLVGNDTDSGVQMAVYDDNGGVPNNLIVSSSQGTVGNGVISLPVTPTVLPAGDYWIMALYEFDGQHSNYYSAPGNAVYYQGLDYGDNMPNNASEFDSYSGHDFLYFLDITCSDILSTVDFNISNNVKIYPNPSKSFIKVSGLTTMEKYTLFDILGKEILSGNISENEKIDTQILSKGTYLLKLSNGNTLRIIKE